MTDSSAVVKHATDVDEVNRANPLETTLTAIQMAMEPGVDVDKLERLLAIQQTLLAEHRKAEFNKALAKAQLDMPAINRNGAIIIADKTTGAIKSKQPYATYEDIDRVIRPIISRNGLATRFTPPVTQGEKLRVTMYVSHTEGHVEFASIDLPADPSGSKNGVQAVGSTFSYAKRYLVTAFFNIITEGQDDDGNGGSDPITQEQADDLRRMITDACSAKGKDEAAVTKRLLKYAGAAGIGEILAKDYKRIVGALEQMKDGGK